MGLSVFPHMGEIIAGRKKVVDYYEAHLDFTKLSKIKIRDSLSNTSEKQMWIQDLDEFEKAYIKWLKDVEKEIVKTNKK